MNMLLYITLLLCMYGMSVQGLAFNETLSKRMIWYASGAYSDNARQCSFPDGDFVVTKQAVVSPLAAFVGYSFNNDAIIVGFKGSESFSQITAEVLNSKPVPNEFVPNSNVVDYFYTAYQSLIKDIDAGVRDLAAQYPHLQLYITGHSLGGAIATLAAFHFKPYKPITYTYGEPRVGDYTFAEAYNKEVGNHFRVVHGDDMVVHVVPCPERASLLKNLTLEGFNQQEAVELTIMLGKDCYADSARESWPAYGYHQLTEVFYEKDMPSASGSIDSGLYKVCTGAPIGEDATCSDKYFAPTGITNHEYYYNMEVAHNCVG